MIDHLVYATRDLGAAARDLESLLGVAASPGGRHPLWGTRNALMALGPRTYLEIVGPDPDSPEPAAPRPFGIDTLTATGLVTWAYATGDLEAVVRSAAAHGVELGEVRTGSRRRPDGTLLRWSMTDVFAEREGGILPFLIDWGDTPHPAAGLGLGLTLVSLRLEHPEPVRITAALVALGLSAPVEVVAAARPARRAVIEGPKGRVEIRG